MKHLKRRTLCLSLLALLLIEVLVCLQYRGPAVVSERDADACTAAGVATFSAERALRIHQQVFDDTPHPAGSAQNDAVRSRLVDLLQKDGWLVKVQSSQVADGTVHASLRLHNVIP